MNYINRLSNENLKYVCSIIPDKNVKDVFKKYPKIFHNIKPGFRSETLNQKELSEILYNHKSDEFISDIINQFISNTLKEINIYLEFEINQGYDENLALLRALSNSYFSKNASIYFRLINREVSREYLNLIDASVEEIEKIEDAKSASNRELETAYEYIDNLNKKIKNYDSKVSKLKEKINSLKNREKEKNNLEKISLEEKNKKYEKQISEYTSTLGRNNKTIEDLNSKLCEYENTISNLESEIIGYKKIIQDSHTKSVGYIDTIKCLRNKIYEYENKDDNYDPGEEYYNDIKNLESAYKVEFSKKISEIESLKMNNFNLEKELASLKEKFKENSISEQKELYPLKPKSIEEFEEFFQYNIDSLGINIDDKVFELFLYYIEKVVFSGQPLLMKNKFGLNFGNILSNTIDGSKNARVINIDNSTNPSDLNLFLHNIKDRVVVINNLIGSSRELEIIPILLSHKNKIIIVTYLYDRTLYYLPKEIMEYLNYINLNNQSVLFKDLFINEDSSNIEEEFYIPVHFKSMNSKKHIEIFDRIAEEVGFGRKYSSKLNLCIEDGDVLDGLLLFTLLPYSRDVLKINILEKSKELQKYIGRHEKNLFKNTYMEWFGLW